MDRRVREAADDSEHPEEEEEEEEEEDVALEQQVAVPRIQRRWSRSGLDGEGAGR